MFKRDSFTCQYCGSQAPDVVLNVDHIVPVSKGGDNKATNLITSCFSCNSGKSDKELSDDSIVKKQMAQAKQIEERAAQIKMIAEWVKAQSSSAEIDAINEVLSEIDNTQLTDLGVRSMKKRIRKHGFKKGLTGFIPVIRALWGYICR